MPPLTRRRLLRTALSTMALGALPKTGIAGRSTAEDRVSPDALTLWYTQPAAQWVEALPIGNGRIGAMVFGGTDEERLQLNEDTLWSGGPYDPVNPEALAALPEVRRLIFAGRYAEAEALANAKMMAKPVRQMSYQSVGDLILSLPANEGEDAVQNYQRQLDLDSAVTTVRFRRGDTAFTREAFASPIDQVIVMHWSADRRGAVTFDARFRPPGPKAETQVLIEQGHLVMRGRNSALHGVPGALKFEARARISVRGGEIIDSGDHIRVRNANSVTVLIAMATSYRSYDDTGGDPSAIVKAHLAGAQRKSLATLRRAHVTEHQRLFRRVSLDLGSTPAAMRPTDERVRLSMQSDDPQLAALYFQFGRYLLISSSRPGTQPANLQGLWNESLSPPWGSKYTININTQMNYWPAESTALGECVEPLVAMVRDLVRSGTRTARVHYGARGWVAHHNTDVWRATAPIDGAKYGVWPTGGAWLCTHLWEHYEYSGDTQYLAEIFPILKGAAEFFLDTLVEEPGHGWLVTAPSISPENTHAAGASICAGPAMDQQILRDLFRQCIAATEVLGVEPEFRRAVQQALARLAPDQIGREGQLQEWLEDWDMQAKDLHHRHVSHLYGLFPSSQINLHDTPALAAAARRSLEIRGDNATGWGIGWRLNLWARLEDAERAHKVLNLLLGPERTYPNLFDAHPPFQIDGNFGGTAGIAQMLMQSYGGNIRLLPALPKAWQAGSVRGLRARGGFVVDVTWNAGELEHAVVRRVVGAGKRSAAAPLASSVRYRDQVIEVSPAIRRAVVVWTGSRLELKPA